MKNLKDKFKQINKNYWTVNKIKSFCTLILLLCSFCIPWYLLSYVIPIPLDYQLAMFIIMIVVFIPLTAYLINKKFIDREIIGISKGKSIKYSFLIGVIGGVLPFIISIWLFSYDKPLPTQYDYVTGVFFAPIWEEYFFRALFFSSLYFILVDYLYLNFLKNPKYDFVKYVYITIVILITSTFFVFIHEPKSASILIASLFFTGGFYFNRSLINPIISHSIYNFCILTFAYISI